MSRDILLEDIQPDPDQPRKHFDQTKLDELAQSIKSVGLASPILLRPVDAGYIIVHGERRFRAVKQLGREAIAAEIREMTEEEARMLALIENVQRDDLSPIEEATAYKNMLATGMTQKQLGEQIGKSQSAIATKLRLLKMPLFLQTLLDRGVISVGHVKQILRLKKFYSGQTYSLPLVHLWDLWEKGEVAQWLELDKDNLDASFVECFLELAEMFTRPLSHLVFGLVSEDDDRNQLLLDSMFDLATATNEEHEAWLPAAWWFAAQATTGAWSVDRLRWFLDYFTDLIDCAVSITYGMEDKREEYCEKRNDNILHAYFTGWWWDLESARWTLNDKEWCLAQGEKWGEWKNRNSNKLIKTPSWKIYTEIMTPDEWPATGSWTVGERINKSKLEYVT